MKITKKQLKRIIREEKARLLKEQALSGQFADSDRDPRSMSDKKAEAIQREYERAKSAIKKGEVAAIDANALIDRSKGGDW